MQFKILADEVFNVQMHTFKIKKGNGDLIVSSLS
jgi:hypothetical protein